MEGEASLEDAARNHLVKGILLISLPMYFLPTGLKVSCRGWSKVILCFVRISGSAYPQPSTVPVFLRALKTDPVYCSTNPKDHAGQKCLCITTGPQKTGFARPSTAPLVANSKVCSRLSQQHIPTYREVRRSANSQESSPP